jgi:glycosyltransferase involved in cell wall biosynthesis
LAKALAERINGQPLSQNEKITVVAMTDRVQGYPYGPEVGIQISENRKDDYRLAAEYINNSRIDVVGVQHEYGLFGGPAGDYLFQFLDRLLKPVVCTLHTILKEPTKKQRDVLRRLCDRSSAVMVMANKGKQILDEVYGVSGEHVHLIHHGVPDVPFGDTEPFKSRFAFSGRPMILTFGLLSPNKGIETMLAALAKVVPEHPDLAYVVLGVTHPGSRRESGESYRLSLESQAIELGIQKNVIFHNRYVSLTDLCEYLQAADIYVTPYRFEQQITSGTLAYALACGKPIVSTPYWHACELLAEGRGLLFDFGDVNQLAHHLLGLLADSDQRQAIRKAAYAFGRRMIWPRVAEDYLTMVEHARERFAAQVSQSELREKVRMRTSLPEIRLDHLYAMTDDTGLIQHAIYATPDRRHGYCTDDNARAIIVTSMAWSYLKDEAALLHLKKYLSFLHFARLEDGVGFRNFMSYDRKWLEHEGSQDCQGRSMWALGYVAAHAPGRSTEQLARELFQSELAHLEHLRHPRSWALGILGLHYYLRKTDEKKGREVERLLGDRLNQAVAEREVADWPWFDDRVTYDNGRIAQSLITAGGDLENQDMIDRGFRVLRWLLDIQTGPEGCLSVIGSDGWMTRDGVRARFDQQPIEPAALIDACKAAYRASEDSVWLMEMRRCFDWYLGRNDVGASLIDFKSHGCHDGLAPEGVNANQGAESVLSWLLSLLIMNEMQTGDPPPTA